MKTLKPPSLLTSPGFKTKPQSMRKLLNILLAMSAVFHLVISSDTGEMPALDSGFPYSFTDCVPSSSSSLSSSSLTYLGSSSLSDDEKRKIQRKYDDLLGLKDIPEKLEFLISLIKEGDKVQSTGVIQMVFNGVSCYDGWTVPILAQKRYHIIFKMLLTNSSEEADKSSYQNYFDVFKTSALAEFCKRNRYDLIAPFLKIIFWKLGFITDHDYRDYFLYRVFRCTYNQLFEEGKSIEAVNLRPAFITYWMSRPEVSSKFVADKLLDPTVAIKAKKTILRYVCKEDLELIIKRAKNPEFKNGFQKILTNSATFIHLNRKAAIYYYFYSNIFEHNGRLNQLMAVLMGHLIKDVSEIVAYYLGVQYKFGQVVSNSFPALKMLT